MSETPKIRFPPDPPRVGIAAAHHDALRRLGENGDVLEKVGFPFQLPFVAHFAERMEGKEQYVRLPLPALQIVEISVCDKTNAHRLLPVHDMGEREKDVKKTDPSGSAFLRHAAILSLL